MSDLDNNFVIFFLLYFFLLLTQIYDISFKNSPCSSLKLYLHSFIHLFNKYMLILYYKYGFILATEDLLVKKNYMGFATVKLTF